MVAEKTAQRGAKLCHILGNTRVDNNALKLYKRLGAQSVGTVSGLFTADEVFLAINNVDVDKVLQAVKLLKTTKDANGQVPDVVLRLVKNFLKQQK